MYNFNEFCDQVKGMLGDALKDRDIESIQLVSVEKNNNVTLRGVVIKEKDVNISPNIYLEHYFDKYENGMAMNAIIDAIVDVWQEHSLKGNQEFENFGNKFSDFEWVKERLIAQIVNTERNSSMLDHMPHKEIMDLSIIFKIQISSDSEEIGSVRIKNEHLAHWGVSVDELAELAIKNTPNLQPPVVRSMFDTLSAMLPDADEFHEPEMENGMYVICNSTNQFGAIYMQDQNTLDDLAKRFNSDVVIIPSSVHEVIAVPLNDQTSIDEVNQMIVEVNTTQVADEEVLSDHAYCYNAETHLLMMPDEYYASKDLGYSKAL